jgi:hypothetical protein
MNQPGDYDYIDYIVGPLENMALNPKSVPRGLPPFRSQVFELGRVEALSWRVPDRETRGRIGHALGLEKRQSIELWRMVARVVRGAQWLEFFSNIIHRDGAKTQARTELRRYATTLAKAEKELQEMSPMAQTLILVAYGDYKYFNCPFGPLHFGNPFNVNASERDWTPFQRCAAEGPRAWMRNAKAKEYVGPARGLALDMLNSLKRPIELLDDAVRKSGVGAPGKNARNFLLAQLMLVYRRVWQEEPTTTPTGRFALMCEFVCDALGADTTGIDKAIERVVARTRRASP